MADICYGVVGESESSCDTGSRAARRRRMDLRRPSLVAGVSPVDDAVKRRRFDFSDTSVENCVVKNEQQPDRKEMQPVVIVSRNSVPIRDDEVKNDDVSGVILPKYGVASVCGRRRDMEDAVAVYPSFCRRQNEDVDAAAKTELHYYGVYDGHGCSHVAMRCRERMHEVVKEEVMVKEDDQNDEVSAWWRAVMERSFIRMDREVLGLSKIGPANCRCELQTPACDAVGSTAVVAVVSPHCIVVGNCGDSRAVLCRNGMAIPLSVDHKPDRPDEMNRIQEAGGRVIFWEGARVLGVLAMSRAIGDSYLKPYVSCIPEVTITERTDEDECLIIASDGLWDVVSNETACGVARMCLRSKPQPEVVVGESGGLDDRACSDASMLLTKLALARRSADNVSVVVVDLRKPE